MLQLGRNHAHRRGLNMENDRVIECLRSFMKNRETAQMGRVATLEHGKGIGGKLLKAEIREIRAKQHPKRIYIEAQCYAAGYYAREGFRICSEAHLNRCIPSTNSRIAPCAAAVISKRITSRVRNA